jgi:glycerophosphoryl diester phosphodiesterase
MSYHDYTSELNLIEIIDSEALTAETLENRNGKLIIERVIGVVDNAKTGAGYEINSEYYISYSDVEGISKVIRECGVEKQVIVKTYVDDKALEAVTKYAPDFMFMPLIWNKDTVTDKLLENGVNVIGAELLFSNENEECASDEYIKEMHEKGLLLWGNSIIYNEKDVISAHHTDDISLTDDPSKGWGWLIDKGFDFIQTDWLLMVKDYIASNSRPI